MLNTNMSNLFQITDHKTRSISAENPKGGKGAGGKEANHEIGPSRKGKPAIMPFKKNKTYTLAEINGPAVIRNIWMTTFEKTEQCPYVLRNLILRMYWDEEKYPSVEVPLGDFFCNGFARSYFVNSLPVAVNPHAGLNCYFPMPFKKKAVITIENQHLEDIPWFFYQINYDLVGELDNNTGYFHAEWSRENPTVKCKDFTIIDNIKGKGKYIGTFLAWATLQNYWWGEGEIKFYIDDDREYPTICGTGTEDYFGGAGCFEKDGKIYTYNTPFLGYPYCSQLVDKKVKRNFYEINEVPMHAMYRWHIYDPINFEKNLKVTIQQIGAYPEEGYPRDYFERSDDISSVAYWYQIEPHRTFKKLLKTEERWPR